MLQSLQPSFTSSLLWITSAFVVFYVYMKYVVYSYWKRSKIPHETPTVPFGNTFPAISGKMSLGNTVKENYEKFKNHRFHGIYMFHKPVLMINDPELIRMVMIKEFNKFPDRGLYFNEKVDPLSGHLFLLPGDRWRHLRAKLSPTFTSGKLKQMFPLLKEVGEKLIETTGKMLKENNIVDTKDLVSRYTNDTIASVAFGFNCNSLENPDNEFKKIASKVFDQSPLKNTLGFFAPSILDLLKIPFNDQEVIDFFIKNFAEMVKYRQQNSVVRKDFMNLLMQLMEKGKLDDDNSTMSSTDRIEILTATAQAFVFFVAGFETTSSTVTYAFYELAKHPEIQAKLQKEIDEANQSSDGITYDKLLNGMSYLHMVFNETLRMHPSVPILNRVCIEDCKIPDSNVVIKKGTDIMISVTGLQHDPRYFPEPSKFDPERFNKENMAKRSPYVYLPFGDGPRICIGNRFGIVQSKMAMVSLLSQYNFSVCEKTPIPVKYSKRAIVQAPDGPVYLRMDRRK